MRLSLKELVWKSDDARRRPCAAPHMVARKIARQCMTGIFFGYAKSCRIIEYSNIAIDEVEKSFNFVVFNQPESGCQSKT
jgi:hypothetical protein